MQKLCAVLKHAPLSRMRHKTWAEIANICPVAFEFQPQKTPATPKVNLLQPFTKQRNNVISHPETCARSQNTCELVQFRQAPLYTFLEKSSTEIQRSWVHNWVGEVYNTADKLWSTSLETIVLYARTQRGVTWLGCHGCGKFFCMPLLQDCALLDQGSATSIRTVEVTICIISERLLDRP